MTISRWQNCKHAIKHDTKLKRDKQCTYIAQLQVMISKNGVSKEFGNVLQDTVAGRNAQTKCRIIVHSFRSMYNIAHNQYLHIKNSNSETLIRTQSFGSVAKKTLIC